MLDLEKVAPADLRLLQQIAQEAYTKNFASHWEADGLAWYLNDQFGDERLQADLNNSNIAYFFIKKEREAIGFVKVKLASKLADFPLDTTAELEKMYILPDHKGKGLGKRILSNIIEKMRRQNKKIFFLCVIDTNEAAIHFYKKLGFSYHSKTRLEVPHFKEELKGMYRMVLSIKK
ncbi:MAG: GNAT family N-acetyltransferase [Bacteroidota bacterium]